MSGKEKTESKNALEISNEKALELVARAKKGGKVRIGINETTKAIERGQAKLIVTAEDIDNKEIIMHLPLLCKEKKVPIIKVSSKKDLGKQVGIEVGTAAIAITEEGDAKKEISELAKRAETLST